MHLLALKKKGSGSPDANSVINAASFKFLFKDRTLVEGVSGTSPLTLSRPAQKFLVDQNGRYSINAINATPYHHTGAGVCQGVLIEGASSNYIRNSNLFTGTGGWEGGSSGSPGGVAGGGALLGLTPTAGVPGPILGLETTAGYTATRYTMDATTGQHYVGKYGGYANLTIEQYVLAFKQNGNTTDYALAIGCGGGSDFTVGSIVSSAGQILRQQSVTVGATFNNSHFLTVRTTADGWVLVSWIMRSTGGGGNNRNPQIGIVKRNGTSWDTSFAGDPGFTFDLFGFSREYSSSQAGRGAERLASSYIHTNAATGPVARAADSLTWASISASLRSVYVEAVGPVYDCSLLSLDDNSAVAFVPNANNAGAYEPDNMIDLRAEAMNNAAQELYGQYRLYIRRGFSVTVDATTDVFTASAAHSLSAGMQVSFRSASLPAPLVKDQLYYVVSTGLTSTAFMVSTTANGAPIDVTVSASSGLFARVTSSFDAGIAPASGTQRFVVSWDASNVTFGSTGSGSATVAHGLGAAPTLTTMRFGTGFRQNRLADLNQPISRAMGWTRVLTNPEQLALLRQP